MLDALIPAMQALRDAGDNLTPEIIKNVSKAAQNGAESTKTLVAKAGRAAYCKDRNTNQAADAGAVMVAHAFAALAEL
jgi:dihydroxyacetone kinase